MTKRAREPALPAGMLRNARDLRRKQTEAERTLWLQLRSRRFGGAKFRRQHPVGPYVADFFSLEHRLVIELDGGQHNDRVAADQQRTRFLEGSGYRVIRFWNHEVLANIDGVLAVIHKALCDPHPPPSPGGRG